MLFSTVCGCLVLDLCGGLSNLLGQEIKDEATRFAAHNNTVSKTFEILDIHLTAACTIIERKPVFPSAIDTRLCGRGQEIFSQ